MEPSKLRVLQYIRCMAIGITIGAHVVRLEVRLQGGQQTLWTVLVSTALLFVVYLTTKYMERQP